MRSNPIVPPHNDRLDNLISLVSLMKSRILELEGEAERARMKAKAGVKKEEVAAG